MAESARPSLARRLIRDTGHAATGRIASVLLWVVLTPPILKRLGAEAFALWAIFFALTGYLTGLDLGIAQSTLRHVAAARAGNDPERARAHATLGMAGYLVLGVVWLLVMIPMAPALLGWLRVPPPLWPAGRITFIASALVFAASGATNIGIATLQGYGRFDLANRALLAVLAVHGLGAWITLARGGGLAALVLVVLAGWLVGVLVTTSMTHANVPGFRWASPRQALHHVREALRFGLPMQTANLSATLHQHLDKILLARLVALAAVAPFEIGFRVASAASTLPQQLLLAIVPAVARLRVEGHDDALKRLYTEGQRYLLALSAVWLAFVFGACLRLMDAWLGPGHAEAGMVARWLTLAWAIALATGMGTSVARGIARTDLEAWFAVIVLLVHLASSLLLIPRLGLLGAVQATVLANAVGALWFLVSLSRALGWSRRAVLVRPFAAPGLAASLGIATAWGLDRLLPAVTGPSAWAATAVIGIAAGAATLGSLFILRALSGEDVRRVVVLAGGPVTGDAR